MQIVIETNRRLTVERRGKVIENWCQQCNQPVAWVTPEEAVILAGISSRAVYQMVESGKAHFTETEDGFLMVCLSSLPVNWRQSSNIPWSFAGTSPETNKIKELLLQPKGQPEPNDESTGSGCIPLFIQEMPESSAGRNSASEMNHSSFAALLAGLDSDPEQAAQKYVALRQRLAKFFECRGCNSTLDLADEVFNRVARRLSEGEIIRAADPAAYFYGVARNVLREYQESRERRFISLDELTPYETPLTDPTETELQGQQRQRLDSLMDCLEICLRELPEETRRLLLNYHRYEKRDRINARKEMAERMGITINALKIRVHRIRASLGRKIKKQMQHKTA